MLLKLISVASLVSSALAVTSSIRWNPLGTTQLSGIAVNVDSVVGIAPTNSEVVIVSKSNGQAVRTGKTGIVSVRTFGSGSLAKIWAVDTQGKASFCSLSTPCTNPSDWIPMASVPDGLAFVEGGPTGKLYGIDKNGKYWLCDSSECREGTSSWTLKSPGPFKKIFSGFMKLFGVAAGGYEGTMRNDRRLLVNSGPGFGFSNNDDLVSWFDASKIDRDFAMIGNTRTLWIWNDGRGWSNATSSNMQNIMRNLVSVALESRSKIFATDTSNTLYKGDIVYAE